MRFCFYVDELTPHLFPLAQEVVQRIGCDEVRYIYTKKLHKERKIMGWGAMCKANWILYKGDDEEKANLWIKNSHILFCRHRDLDVWELRAKRGLITLYMSERWLRPRHIFTCLGRDILLPGWLCLFKPGQIKTFIRAVKLFKKYRQIVYLAAGVYAAEDMARLVGLYSGDLKCFFDSPKLSFESRPNGQFKLVGKRDSERYCVDRMRVWGYFVAQSTLSQSLKKADSADSADLIRLLWIGRVVALKRVDVIIRAVILLEKQWVNSGVMTKCVLDIYGDGPEKERLKFLSRKHRDLIIFHDSIPFEAVRPLMRAHDLIVLSSNGEEGWGAVVNEGLEEEIGVIGTYEAGSSATILPPQQLFHSGDVDGLVELLKMFCRERHSKTPLPGIKEAWSVRRAADELLSYKPYDYRAILFQ